MIYRKFKDDVFFCHFYYFSDEFLSNCQCDFRKSYNTQYCLLNIREKWKFVVNKGKELEVFHLSFNVLDCLYDELLLATLHVRDLALRH